MLCPGSTTLVLTGVFYPYPVPSHLLVKISSCHFLPPTYQTTYLLPTYLPKNLSTSYQTTYLSTYKQPTFFVPTNNLPTLYLQTTYLLCTYKQPTSYLPTNNLPTLYLPTKQPPTYLQNDALLTLTGPSILPNGNKETVGSWWVEQWHEYLELPIFRFLVRSTLGRQIALTSYPVDSNLAVCYWIGNSLSMPHTNYYPVLLQNRWQLKSPLESQLKYILAIVVIWKEGFSRTIKSEQSSRFQNDGWINLQFVSLPCAQGKACNKEIDHETDSVKKNNK